MADNKTVLLLSSTNLPGECVSNKWTKIPEATIANFINNIETNLGQRTENKESLRAMVSGIPSPWARVSFTKRAVFQNRADLGASVLDECYKAYKSEWRGLMAAYVLHPESFSFSEPIQLVGRDIKSSFGEMSLLNIYGDMLFKEAPLWTLSSQQMKSGENPPCIQILYYTGKDEFGRNTRVAVGATSPYTMLFTSVNYSLKGEEREIPWIDADGKFYDPTHLEDSKISSDDIQRLHSFIHNVSSLLIQNEGDSHNNPDKYYLNHFANVCRNNPDSGLDLRSISDDIRSWGAELGRWENELLSRLQVAGRTANTNVPIAVAMPQGPLALLMNNEHTFYIDGKNVFSRPTGLQTPIEISSSEILIDSECIAAWKAVADAERDHAKSPVYYLKDDSNCYYLALPFTKKALSVFGNAISDIMKGSEGLSLIANVKDGKVEIDFKAKIDGSQDMMSICKKTYALEIIPESEGKAFIWPDFQSEQWNKYFYYSEFPTNVTGIRLLPNFGGVDFEDIDKEKLKDMYLVKYPVNRVATNMHKYEIIASDKPLHSITVRLNKSGNDINGGVLLLKTEQSEGALSTSKYLKNLKSISTMTPATVGIDFGSTNSCVYYKLDGSVDSIPVPFSNRRLALVGFDNKKLSLAQKDELFFISNEGTLSPNGQIKSWLHEHDPQYLNTDNGDGDIRNINNLDKEIVGGVPVNESNIPVVSMDEFTIKTNAGVLHYNMKWLEADESIKRKKSFMKMLWIQICADMVAAGAYPSKLNWSFPSAMGSTDTTALKDIYRSASEYPFESSGKPRPTMSEYTEAESVCAYAIYKGTEVTESSLSLGVDIGGSTSDILIMGSKNNINTLLTQSSVRLAGGFFFSAINSSEKFRRALYNFHESHRTSVKVLNISDIVSTDPSVYKRAPYYLNSIFDQLHESRDFEKFYEYLHTDVPAVFALPAYVTGVLLFYAGKLVRNVVVKNSMENIKRINARYYGKGGRLFEWLLDKYEDDALRYYKKCFLAGYGSNDVDFILDNFVNEDERYKSKAENKSEVAMGLVSDNFGSIANLKNDEDKRVIENYDILGEKGLVYAKPGMPSRELSDMEVIPNELFDGGINISFPERMENFNAFLDVFLKFIEVDSGGIIRDMKTLNEGRENLRVLAFIQNDPEYRKFLKALAKGQNDACYRMPVFIAAALSYLNNVLLPVVAKQI